MKADEFLKAVETASPGERIVYHTGNLADDRERSRELDAVAAAAWKIGAPTKFIIGGGADAFDASGFGAGSLVQQRHSACIYDYILVMRRPLTNVDSLDIRKCLKGGKLAENSESTAALAA
jgi:hypothetical protein